MVNKISNSNVIKFYNRFIVDVAIIKDKYLFPKVVPFNINHNIVVV